MKIKLRHEPSDRYLETQERLKEYNKRVRKKRIEYMKRNPKHE